MLLALRMHSVVKLRVVRWRQLNTREQIVSDTSVKRDIVRSELGQVDVLQCTKTDLVFLPVKNTTQVTASSQNSLEGTHTEIVVILG